MNPLERLFEAQLSNIYYAEKQIVKILPRLARTAESRELKEAFMIHAEQTSSQIKKLETAFHSINREAKATKCGAIVGILNEAKAIINVFGSTAGIDAALICLCQKIEHYEIATYGCLITWAKSLGHLKAARLLGQILDQEEITDRELTAIAEYVCNGAAENEAA